MRQILANSRWSEECAQNQRVEDIEGGDVCVGGIKEYFFSRAEPEMGSPVAISLCSHLQAAVCRQDSRQISLLPGNRHEEAFDRMLRVPSV